MQALAYEGYFKNGRFYASGKTIQIPEEQRIVITILRDTQDVGLNDPVANTSKPTRKIGFLNGPPLPDSFFDPLPEEELELWGL